MKKISELTQVTKIPIDGKILTYDRTRPEGDRLCEMDVDDLYNTFEFQKPTNTTIGWEIGNVLPLSAVSNLSAVQASELINLTWTLPSVGITGIDFQSIERSVSGSNVWTVVSNNISSNAVSFTDNFSFSPNTNYIYRHRTRNAAGFSNYSNLASITTSSINPPNAVNNLSMSIVTTTGGTLTWTLPNNGGSALTSQRIERSPAGANTWTVLNNAIAGNATSFLDNTGLSNTAYDYRHRSTNAVGNSDYSNTFTVTTIATSPILTGLDSWIDASDTATLTLVDGTDVSQITSKVAGSRLLAQSTSANRPNSGSTVNGNNAISFNGTSDFMIMSNPVAWGTQNHTIFFVALPQEIRDQKFFIGHNGGSGVVGLDTLNFGANLRFLNGNSASINNIGNTYLNNRSIIASRRNGTLLEGFYNRGLTASVNTIANQTTPNAWVLGREEASGGRQYFRGLFCELLVYGRALTNEEMTNVTNYLAAKWGVTLI